MHLPLTRAAYQYAELVVEKLANNNRSNVQNKHTHKAFAEEYPEGAERTKAVSELMRKVDLRKNQFSKWMKSAKPTTFRFFRPLGKYMKES